MRELKHEFLEALYEAETLHDTMCIEHSAGMTLKEIATHLYDVAKIDMDTFAYMTGYADRSWEAEVMTISDIVEFLEEIE